MPRSDRAVNATDGALDSDICKTPENFKSILSVCEPSVTSLSLDISREKEHLQTLGK